LWWRLITINFLSSISENKINGMKKSVKNLLFKLQEDKSGKLKEGYTVLRNIRGGKLGETNSGICNNEGTCSGTNSGVCTNSGDCTNSTNHQCTNPNCY
jgi:hypothetical protein